MRHNSRFRPFFPLPRPEYDWREDDRELPPDGEEEAAPPEDQRDEQSGS